MSWGMYSENKWRKKLPEEFRDCSEEELQRQIDRLYQEFQDLVKDGACSEEELLQFLRKNQSLISAADLQNKYQLEKKVWEQ